MKVHVVNGVEGKSFAPQKRVILGVRPESGRLVGHGRELRGLT
jgi:hypothetical protein